MHKDQIKIVEGFVRGDKRHHRKLIEIFESLKEPEDTPHYKFIKAYSEDDTEGYCQYKKEILNKGITVKVKKDFNR